MLYNVYFSAKGTTKKCAQYIASEINMEMREYNWLVDSERKEIDLMKEDVLLLSMPVYGGFIPKICIPWTERIKGMVLLQLLPLCMETGITIML